MLNANAYSELFCQKLLTNKAKCDIIFKHDLFAPVAQSVEHLTFNQRVRDSSSRRSTNKKDHPCDGLFLLPLVRNSFRHAYACHLPRGWRLFRSKNLGNNLDLDEDGFWKSFYCYAGASGFFGKVASVNLVEGGKICHIRKEAGGLYCAFK